MLTVVDDFSRECVDIAVDYGMGGHYVARMLDQVGQFRGYPRAIRTDQGPEFTSRAFMAWAHARGVQNLINDAGKPTQNAYVESFNGKFRDECLSLEWFRSRAEAKVIIEAWRQHYNQVRPHSSLDYLTPNEFVARGAKPAPRQATGRDAAVHGASASRPVAQPSRRGQMQPAREAVSS